MKKELNCILYLFIILFFLTPNTLWAQGERETTVEFSSSNTLLEDDPNNGVYNITIYSPDGQWKMQLNYHSDSMFGTFTNDDFHLSTDGKYYNYVRNPKNDMVFYSFTDMQVTVTNEVTCYRVKANCLTNNKMRFLVDATIDAPQPESTITSDLGYARVTQNNFYGIYTIKAENEKYKLEYGIVSDHLLGTFYRADLLKPELHDKVNNKDIELTTATATHTQNGDNTEIKIDLLSTDKVLYSLTMFNGPHDVEVTGEQDILIANNAVMQDLTQMYGCYQFGGQNDEYAVAIALTPDAVESGRHEWTMTDIFLPYTNIVKLSNNEFIDIFDVKASLSNDNNALILHSDVLSMDGILYHITMNLKGGDTAPETKDTVDIDFGNVAVLDYSKGLGVVGIGAVVPDKYQIRCYLNATNLTGNFTNQEFVLDMCDIMVVNDEKKTYVFHDAKYVTASMVPENDGTKIYINMVGVDDVLYRATMRLELLKCMSDMDLTISHDSGVQFIGIQDGVESNYAEYTLQLQDMDNVYDEDYNIIGDGYALSFYLGHDGTASIAGDYGYSAGTLAEDEIHTFFEKGCEVRVAPVAGTLGIVPIEQVSVKIGLTTVKTYVYQIKFQFLGQNGAIYRGEGENFLLCLNTDEKYLNMDESAYTGICESMAEQGYQVRKVLKNGKIVLEKQGREYDLRGIETK